MDERLEAEGDEVTLHGGIAHPGAVVRIGATVRRPAGPHTPAVHAFLRHLRAAGFDGAPGPHGLDDDGREIVDFLPGAVADPPFPAWAWSDDALGSVAALTRRFHEAARSFHAPAGAAWGFEAPAGWGGTFVGHNDVCPENVVFRDGAAVGLIDFDFAGPADPLFDVAATAYYWMPLVAPEDLDVDLDRAARLRLFADVYGLPRAGREHLVRGLGAYLGWGERLVTARIAAGEPGFVEMGRRGWAERKARAKAWFAVARGELERAVVSG
ncbi:MAG TPA: phosphotransferase [Acidimicrobiia bacterium]|nr:phosphotransferase [Acidimicrobiia bacterium]